MMWRATVTSLTPLMVNIAGVTDVDGSVPCEPVSDATLVAVGDRVYVTQITGGFDWALVPSKTSGGAGTVGPAGPAGPVGPAGTAGSTGVAGPAGPIGTTGPAGSTGLTGAIGATGPAGPAGPAGATGAGTQGPAGPAGATGPAGPAGPTGPPASTTINIPLTLIGVGAGSSFGTNISAYGGSYSVPSYQKQAGIVTVSGLFKSAAAIGNGGVICTLPTSCLPVFTSGATIFICGEAVPSPSNVVTRFYINSSAQICFNALVSGQTIPTGNNFALNFSWAAAS